jgi:hypothetical protein
MGLVKCFTQDVFVSYGWLDNETFGPEERKWVEEFTASLQGRLSQLTGNRASLWRDFFDLRGNQRIWPSIEQAISRSALFLSVITPRYVTSVSCHREMNHFRLAGLLCGGPTVGAYERVFHVIKIPIPSEQMPTIYRNQNGYEFFQRSGSKGYPLELSPGNPDYRARINELAHDMSSVLSALERRANGGA